MDKVKPSLLRGFDQEYLPHEQLQFNALVDLIRRTFERYGFLPIETLSPQGKPYDPWTVVPAFQKQLRDAIQKTARA